MTFEEQDTLRKMKDVYEHFAPRESVNKLQQSLEVMYSERRSFKEIIAFISSCLQFGLTLNRW